MRGSLFTILLVSAVSGALFWGCEWTSSDEESSWSGSYDNMNFAGTYRIGVTIAEGGGTPTDDGETATQIITVEERVGAYNSNDLAYSGKLHGGVVVGSVKITAGNKMYSDNGAGVLEGNMPTAGSGKINYSSGAWEFTTLAAFANSGNIIATYSYTLDVQGGSSGEGTDPAAPTAARSITVTQTGQYLTLRMTNGATFEGRFTKVNELSGGTYNAQFQVSGAKGTIVGTFDSTSGMKVLDGTWTSGRNVYDIHGVGGAVAPGRSNIVE
ncbi:MAG: hypothetical protein ACOX9C_02650 [Kiritimatiellia bacterium]|jgi:hypothetical protein